MGRTGSDYQCKQVTKGVVLKTQLHRLPFIIVEDERTEGLADKFDVGVILCDHDLFQEGVCCDEGDGVAGEVDLNLKGELDIFEFWILGVDGLNTGIHFDAVL